VSDHGHFADNVMRFCRTLRAAGLPIGPGQVIDALRAVGCAGTARRDDFYWSLHAVLVNRRNQHVVFDQAFHAFWRSPDLLTRLAGMVMPDVRQVEDKQPPVSRRVAEAMAGGRDAREDSSEPDITFDAALTASGREVLQKLDFEQMSAAEIAAAKQAIRRMGLAVKRVATRRYRASNRGLRIDLRRSLRAGLRAGGDTIPLLRRRRAVKPPPLVILCDISGSMGRYSRMLLHFMHALTSDRDRVHSFVFGTRLTNITRHLRHRDVDISLDAVIDEVEDWSGGTRIGACLHTFNKHWSRRVLGQGAIVILISDGLDRLGGEGLDGETERLHKSCRRLIWLNPLLRYDGFEAKAAGVRAMLPHVDDFRPVHNLASLAELAQALGDDKPHKAAA
jgi:uncharacterized protein with von Willebrand factor type A (vWA) domain